MSANSALLEITAVSGQDGYMTPLAINSPNSAFIYADLENPFVAEYSITIKFAKTESRVTYTGNVNFGSQATIELEKIGIDLATGVKLIVTLPALEMYYTEENDVRTYTNKVRWCPNPGHNIIEETWIDIGGAEIERQSAMWLDIISDIRIHTENSRKAYNTLIGQQNLKVLSIGRENLENVRYLTADDFNIFSTLGGSDGAGVLATPAATTVISYVTLAIPVPVIDNLPATGVASITDWVPQSFGPLETEGVVTQGYDGLQTYKVSHPATTVRICYKFWFCDRPFLALPVISLSLQSIQIHTKFRRFEACVQYKDLVAAESPSGRVINTTNLSLLDPIFYIDSVFVDSLTRTAYTTLRTQIMMQLVDCIAPTDLNKSTKQQIKVNSNHPSDELLWVIQDSRSVENFVNEYTNYYIYNDGTGGSGVYEPGTYISDHQPLITAQLYFQNQNRTDKRDWQFFRLEQMLAAHKNVPGLNVYGYSFSLDPESYQINGTANFSRIDDVSLSLELNQVYQSVNASIHMFNVHRNFFRIAGSQGGKIFSA